MSVILNTTLNQVKAMAKLLDEAAQNIRHLHSVYAEAEVPPPMIIWELENQAAELRKALKS